MKHRKVRATKQGAARRASHNSKSYVMLTFNFLLGVANIVQMVETFGLTSSLKHLTDSMV